MAVRGESAWLIRVHLCLAEEHHTDHPAHCWRDQENRCQTLEGKHGGKNTATTYWLRRHRIIRKQAWSLATLGYAETQLPGTRGWCHGRSWYRCKPDCAGPHRLRHASGPFVDLFCPEESLGASLRLPDQDCRYTSSMGEHCLHQGASCSDFSNRSSSKVSEMPKPGQTAFL